MKSILEINELSKEFPGVKALNSVSLKVVKGEVHALVGENGAGKSTLIKIITGVHKQDAGSIVFDGLEMQNMTPTLSRQIGISVIYQELDVIPHLNVLQNIFLGREPQLKIPGLIDNNAMVKQIVRAFKFLNVSIPLYEPIKTLSIREQQIAVIVKALLYEAKLIIMDEPTAALVDEDVQNLYRIIRLLKERGMTFIYISHRLNEIFEIADRVTVLRDGLKIVTLNITETNNDDLIKNMIGREISIRPPDREDTIDKTSPVLKVSHLSVTNKIKDVSFDLFKGEILGVTGLVGAGKTELGLALFGMYSDRCGEVILEGMDGKAKNPPDAINKKIIYMTDNRKVKGLFPNFNVKDNITINSLNKDFVKFGVINSKFEISSVLDMIKRLDIRPPRYDYLVSGFSGGNQQKTVLAKCLMISPRVLIIDEPTRGVDVGAKEEIYRLLYGLKDKGCSIIMISSELPEILRLSNRILIMHEGKVSGIIPGESANEEIVMKYATGNHSHQKIS